MSPDHPYFFSGRRILLGASVEDAFDWQAARQSRDLGFRAAMHPQLVGYFRLDHRNQGEKILSRLSSDQPRVVANRIRRHDQYAEAEGAERKLSFAPRGQHQQRSFHRQYL